MMKVTQAAEPRELMSKTGTSTEILPPGLGISSDCLCRDLELPALLTAWHRSIAQQQAAGAARQGWEQRGSTRQRTGSAPCLPVASVRCATVQWQLSWSWAKLSSLPGNTAGAGVPAKWRPKLLTPCTAPPEGTAQCHSQWVSCCQPQGPLQIQCTQGHAKNPAEPGPCTLGCVAVGTAGADTFYSCQPMAP